MISQFSDLPEINQTLEIEGFLFTILETSQSRILKLKVEKIA